MFAEAPRNSMKWKPSTQEVTLETLPTILTEHDCVVLHFWAEWDLLDRTMDERLGKVIHGCSDRIFFGSFDTDPKDHWATCNELRLKNLPALVAFVNGKHLETTHGLRSEAQPKEKFEEWLVAARL